MPGPVFTKQEKGKSAGRPQGRAPQPDSRFRSGEPYAEITDRQPVGNRAAAMSYLAGELQRDIKRIKDELDSLVYTEGVEERVITILWHWAGRGPMASGYLDWIFDGLQATKSGIFNDTTYYDAMFDNFDRVDEIRMIREGSMRYSGRESARETRRQAKEAERQAEEKARREEIDRTADLAGKWIENKAEPYEIPPTPMNISLAELQIRRMGENPEGQLLPCEKMALAIISKLPPREKPLVLLKKVHMITESERIERRQAQIREIVHPLLEMLLWATAERIVVFGVEAILARLFAVEARAAVTLASAESKAAAGALARRGAAKGGFPPGGGRVFTGPGFEHQIKSINPVTGEAVAMGRNLKTGEIVTVRMNIDTGAGFATRTNGEILPIRGGRLESPKPVLPAASTKSTAQAAGSLAKTPRPEPRPKPELKSSPSPELRPKPEPSPRPVKEKTDEITVAGAKTLPPGGQKSLPPPAPLTQRDLMELFVEKYKVPVPGLEFYQGYRNYAEYKAAYLRRFTGHKGPVPRGWFDPLTKLIHFPPGAVVHTKVHETLHWYGAKNHVGMNLGSFINEGLTDWLTRNKLGERTGKHVYDVHVRFVRELAGNVGEEPLMLAFLHGRWDYFHHVMNKQAGSLNNAQQAFGLLRNISSDGKGIKDLAGVRSLLRMKPAKPIPKGPKPPGKPKPGPPSKKPGISLTKPVRAREADFLPGETNFIPYEICQEDKTYVQNLLATVLKGLSKKTRANIKRNKTIAITLVQDIDDGHLHLIWTGSRNFGNKEIEAAMARHGVTRWNAANPGVKGRGEVGAPQDAEQLMAELFDQEDPDFIPLLIVPSRPYCADCSILLKKLKVPMIKPPQW